MEIVQTVVELTVLVVIGNVLAHFIKRLPVSLIQIGLGLGVALVFNLEINIQTEWFLPLFVAPLLYSDAWNFPKRELWELRGPIFGNAILLVFATTILGGYAIYWLIPQVPLPVAFAIAAILSPTDPVAVASVGEETALPPSLMHLVAGESLINDASGLVAFKFAIAAVSAGTFSLLSATTGFIYMTVVGVLLGLGLGTAISWLNLWLIRHQATNSVISVVMQILTPYLIYLVTEEVGASGVVAVVIAAIIQNLQLKNQPSFSGEYYLVNHNTWNVFSYLLNGYIFVILGIELPVAMGLGGNVAPRGSIWQLLAYALATWMILLIIRTVWSYMNQLVRRRTHEATIVSWRLSLMAGLTGVRGAVTMAGVLSVPLLTKNGQPFPERSLMLFIAGMVIVLSLLAAIFFLPLLAQPKTKKITQPLAGLAKHMTVARAQVYILQSAVREIEQLLTETNAVPAYQMMMRYQVRIRRLQLQYLHKDKVQKILKSEAKLRELAITAQREALKEDLANKSISGFVFDSENRRLDRIEGDLDSLIMPDTRRRLTRQFKLWLVRELRALRIWLNDNDSDVLRAQYQLAEQHMAQAALVTLEKFIHETGTSISKTDMITAHQLMTLFRSRLVPRKTVGVAKEKQLDQRVGTELEMAGYQAQRAALAHLYEAHFIDDSTASQLRQWINLDETSILVQHKE